LLAFTALLAIFASMAGVLIQLSGGNPALPQAPAPPPGGGNPGHRTRLASGAARFGRSLRRPLGIPGDWHLILNQTFDGPSLDSSIWRPGWFGNGVTGPVNRDERACYNPANLHFSAHGLAFLVTHRRSRCSNRTEPYTGALISTNPYDGRRSGGFQFRYGVVQAEVYLPGTHGLLADWPVVMALGHNWPRDGEDDILEGLGGVACHTFHNRSGQAIGCDRWLSPGWNVVAVDWQPHAVTYYYDGIRVGTVTRGVTHSPEYLVVLNTVSRRFPKAIISDSMRVSYVRVWTRG
jgi:hypothetical protein